VKHYILIFVILLLILCIMQQRAFFSYFYFFKFFFLFWLSCFYLTLCLFLHALLLILFIFNYNCSLVFLITQSSFDSLILFFIKKFLGFALHCCTPPLHQLHTLHPLHQLHTLHPFSFYIYVKFQNIPFILFFRIRAKHNFLKLISIFNGIFFTQKKKSSF
jgi:hypothetical protein